MPGKSRVGKTLATIAVAGIFVLLLIGTSPPPPQINEYVMKDTIRWGSLDVKVLAIERANVYKELALKPGDEFIVVTLKFKNSDSYSASFPAEPDQFYLIEDGERYTPADMMLEKKNPYIHRFDKEEEAKGTYVFMIPKGQTGLVLRFDYTKSGGLVQSKVFLD